MEISCLSFVSKQLENRELFEAYNKILETHRVANDELSEKQVCVNI